MIESILEIAIQQFAQLTYPLSDAQLERPWTWQDYEEGVRFAFFRNYEDLRMLSARLEQARAISSQPLTLAQRILAQYHSAYRDLQALLIGVSDGHAETSPGGEDWSLRKVLTHIIQAERTFFAINLYSLERERSKDSRPLEMSDAAWEAFWAGDPFPELGVGAPFSSLLAYYDGLHQRVLQELASGTEAELDTPAVFWESTPMPVWFRMGRFDSHLRQHTVQVEKTLADLGYQVNEAKRLLRLIYAALAEVEGNLVGNAEFGAGDCQMLASQIVQRTGEIAALFEG